MEDHENTVVTLSENKLTTCYESPLDAQGNRQKDRLLLASRARFATGARINCSALNLSRSRRIRTNLCNPRDGGRSHVEASICDLCRCGSTGNDIAHWMRTSAPLMDVGSGNSP